MKQQALLPGVPLPRIPAENAAQPPQGQPVSTATEALNTAASEAAQGGEDWPALHDMMGSLFVFELDHPRPRPVEVLGLDCRELSAAGQEALKEAQVVAGGQKLLDRFCPGWKESAGSTEYLVLCAPLESVLAELEERRKSGKLVLVLADGDPLFFGIGATLSCSLDAAQLRCIPGISALQEACARASLPWHDVRCVSLHGRNTHEGWRAFNAAVFSGKPVCVLTDASAPPDELARHLLDRGVEWLEVWICERLNQEDERVRCLSLREAASLGEALPTGEALSPGEALPFNGAADPKDPQAERKTFLQPCTVLLRPVGTPRRPRLGLGDSDLAVEKGLITKAPVRAAALSLLQILPQHVVWDIGSGSGSVALEACALAHEGCVVAVERSSGRAFSIRENRRRFGAAILEVHHGMAPDCFHHLPAPQRVFVGGGLSGEQGEDILAEICRILPAGGRVVVSCVLLGTLHRASEFFRLLGWDLQITQVLASDAAPLAEDYRLIPHNPVFLLACQKP